MLETVDPRTKVDKASYRQWFPRLENDLRELQQTIREARLPVLILLEGAFLSGRVDAIRKLSEAMDPRGFKVHSTKYHSAEEELRHWMWRYWIRLPERGTVGLFERSWYGRVLDDRVFRPGGVDDFSSAYQEINQTEEMLANDGAVILKFFLHIDRKIQHKRLKDGEDDPYWRYLIGKEQWAEHELLDVYTQTAEEMLERTSTHQAPWNVVEAGDKRYRRMKIFQTIIESVVGALNSRREPRRAVGGNGSAPEPLTVPVLEEMPTVLDKVDFPEPMSEDDYDERKKDLQEKLRAAQFEAIERRIAQVIVFEGWDAAGKGGTIRRLTAYLDPHYYDVIPVSKPTQEELAHHYLWRFWRWIPRKGHTTIFDRSWYGRVLVERVEKLAPEADWRRAYQEINEFETMLYRGHATIVKFWLHITPEEQLRRFRAREADPHKQWKLTEEDWRNREKWDVYREAIDEMIQRTSTTYAPWHVVPSNCKRCARVRCMEIVLESMKEAFERQDAAAKENRKGRRK